MLYVKVMAHRVLERAESPWATQERNYEVVSKERAIFFFLPLFSYCEIKTNFFFCSDLWALQLA